MGIDHRGRKRSGPHALRAAMTAIMMAAAPGFAAQPCNFDVNWKKLVIGNDPLAADSKLKVTGCTSEGENPTVYNDGSRMAPSATLECVMALYDKHWVGEPEDRSEGSKPEIWVTPREGLGVEQPIRRSRAAGYEDWWVVRSSPHGDSNIQVCAGASIWLEVARRPRFLAPDLKDLLETTTTEVDVIRTRALDAAPVLKLWRLGSPAAASPAAAGGSTDPSRALMAQLEVVFSPNGARQFPAPGEVVEPWQQIVLVVAGSGPPCETCQRAEELPPRDPLDDELVSAAAGAAGGGLLLYTLGRRRQRRVEAALGKARAATSKPPPKVEVRIRRDQRLDA